MLLFWYYYQLSNQNINLSIQFSTAWLAAALSEYIAIGKTDSQVTIVHQFWCTWILIFYKWGYLKKGGNEVIMQITRKVQMHLSWSTLLVFFCGANTVLFFALHVRTVFLIVQLNCINSEWRCSICH